MSGKLRFSNIIEEAVSLRHAPRRKILAVTLLHIVLLFFTLLGWNIVRDENGGGSFINVETGKKYHVEIVGPGSSLGENGERQHAVRIYLIQNDILQRIKSHLPFTDHLVLELNFDRRIQPGLLDFSQAKTKEGYGYHALLVFDEIVDMVHTRVVCGNKDWEDPLSYGDSGQLFLKDYNVTYKSGLENIHGEVEVPFQNCQIDEWGINGEDIILVGTFYR